MTVSPRSSARLTRPAGLTGVLIPAGPDLGARRPHPLPSRPLPEPGDEHRAWRRRDNDGGRDETRSDERADEEVGVEERAVVAHEGHVMGVESGVEPPVESGVEPAVEPCLKAGAAHSPGCARQRHNSDQQGKSKARSFHA
jgi:hypothetical protein